MNDFHPDTHRLIRKAENLLRSSSKVRGQFCLSDLSMALAMLDRARIATDPEARLRALNNALRSFDSVSRIFSRLQLDRRMQNKIAARLEVVRQRLAESRPQ